MSLTNEQIELRKTGIGGSDAGAVLGLNPFKTPVDVYLEKMGKAFSVEENDAIYWGNVLEDVVAQEYARRKGVKVQRRNTHFQHQEHSFMQANIDRWVVGQNKVLECKTAGQYVSDQWGPDGSDQVPDSYLIQCTHYMLVMDVDVADLAVLIGGRDFRTYTIGLDRELADIVIQREYDFWHNHVLKEIPPAPTCLSDLQQLYPADNGEKVVADLLTENKVTDIKTIKTKIKELELLKKQLELDVKTKIGGGSILLNGDGDVITTWKKAKDSTCFDLDRFKEECPDAYNHYLYQKQGSRRFLIK